MAKSETILLRISAKEKKFIRDQAKKKGMNMTEYICWCVDLNNSDKAILKSELAQYLIELAAILDCSEVKSTRLARDLRKKFKKVWKLL